MSDSKIYRPLADKLCTFLDQELPITNLNSVQNTTGALIIALVAQARKLTKEKPPLFEQVLFRTLRRTLDELVELELAYQKGIEEGTQRSVGLRWRLHRTLD